jgi:hypothetical protein
VAASGVLGRARSLAVENLNLKLFSLTFALLLYSVVHGSQDAQRSLLVSVVALTPPETSNRELATTIPSEVRVTISGLRSTLNELHADDLGNISLDLRKGDEQRVTFEPNMIPLPPGLKVERIDPPAIDLAWEERIVRSVPVEVGVTGTPVPGFVVDGPPVAEPSSLRVSGPKSQVTVLQRVLTEPFDATGLKEGRYTRFLTLGRSASRVTYDVANVSATLEIGREVVERLFPLVPITVVGRLVAKAQPGAADIRVSCPPDIVHALRPEQLVAHVQITSTLDHGSDILPVQAVVDECVVHAMPSAVAVRW